MSYGKMNCFIDILSTQPTKDSEGFVTTGDMVLASVRAYKENKHSSERWANRTAFSEATVLFRFRVIPGVTIDTKLVISDAEGRYNVLSAEDVRRRGMYIECLCERIEGSVA